MGKYNGYTFKSKRFTNCIECSGEQINNVTINGTAFDLSANRSWTIAPIDTTLLHGQLVQLGSQVAINSSNIATNTTNIASNASAITTKLNITDTTNKWVQDVRSNIGGDSLIVNKNGVRNAYKYPAGGVGGITKAYAPLVVTSGGDSISMRINVKKYGAKGDGVTNDGPAIKVAIKACDSIINGCSVFFPNGIYYDSDALDASCNCQIPIPYRGITDSLRNHITLIGESKPNMDDVGGGLAAATSEKSPISGVIIKSSITSGSAGSSVIGSQTSGINENFLAVENIAIQIKNNYSGGGPALGGINFAYGASLYCKYVTVYIDTSGYRSVQPTNDVAGIETPTNGATSFNILENTLCSGFRSDYKIGEHCLLLNPVAYCGYYGFNFKTGGNTSIGPRLEAQWCAYDFYVSGNPVVFGNFNLATEIISIGKWYDNLALVKDSANQGTGQIYYTINYANGTGFANTIKSGGNNIHMLTHAEGVASFASGMAIGNTVTSGTAGSVLYAGAANVLAQDNANFFYDYTNHRLDRHYNACNRLRDKIIPKPTINLNTSIANGAPSIKFQKSGTNKWGIFLNEQGNSLSSFSCMIIQTVKRKFSQILQEQ